MSDRGPSTTAVVRVTLTVAAVVAVLFAGWLVRDVLILVVIAAFLAVGLDPLVRALQRLRLGRGGGVAIVLFVGLLVVGGFIASVAPALARQTQRLATEVPGIVTDLSERNERFRELDERYDVTERLQELVAELPERAAGSIDGVLGVAAGIGRALFSIVTVGILTVYLLLDLPRLIDGAARLVPKDSRVRGRELADIVFGRISGYLIGQLAVSAIAAVTALVGLAIIGVPYALPLAMWVGIAALIPMVGSTIGAIPAVIVAFFVSVPTGLATLAFFLVYQQAENYVVAPRVMRRAVDLSAAAVILAALVGATLLGFVGALLAIPVAASLKALVQAVWLPRQEAAAAV